MLKPIASLSLALSLSFASAMAHANNFEAIQRQAIQGDKDAQYQLSELYFDGKGVDADIEQAINWARKAAEQGQLDAQLSLAMLYHMSDLVHKDMKKTLQWYARAMAQGSTDAMINVGAIFNWGESMGVKQSFSKAAYFYKKAADLGDPYGMYYLATLYDTYRADPSIRNLEKSREYLQKAADLGLEDAQHDLFFLVYDLTADNLATDEDAYFWFEVLRHHEDYDAQTYQAFEKELKVNPEQKKEIALKAIAYYEQAAERWEAYEASQKLRP